MQVRDLVGVFTFGAPMATRRDYDMVGIRPEVPLGSPGDEVLFRPVPAPAGATPRPG